MGLGGFLAAQSEAEHYMSERRREEREVVECPEEEEEECYEVLAEYGITREVSPLPQIPIYTPSYIASCVLRSC
jgi:vacuolar iron transporter family protein